jgi:hypothetical protein
VQGEYFHGDKTVSNEATIKRKRDDAPEPAQSPLQTKKLKTHHSDKQLAKQLHEGNPHTDTKARNASRKVRPRKLVEEKEPE